MMTNVVNLQEVPVTLGTRVIKTNELNCMQFNVSESEVRLGKEVVSCVNKTLSYENEQLRRVAKSLIPLDEINGKVQARLDAVVTKDLDYSKDFLIIELLDWFKTKFFRWVDVPNCTFCNVRMKNNGYAAPSVDDLKWDAVKVELFFCPLCKSEKRFPRYNHPGKLLSTREGRCGEWANCFALLCRSLNFDTRFVNDWNDHVWVEVYSESQKQWMHCDPCENTCDKPLSYEKGWGKNHSYVLAFSKVEIQDVTWRYTSKFKEVIDRRKLCRESWLLNLIDNVSTLLQRYLDNNQKKIILDKRVAELVEFLTPANAQNEEMGGRKSGSLEWRLARGELPPPKIVPFVFIPTQSEMVLKEMHIAYTPITDKYTRMSDPSDEAVNTSNGWQSCVFKAESIARKVEHDWKMAYLSRQESHGSQTGYISWKFDLRESDFVFDRLSFMCQSATFESGQVLWKVSDENRTISYPNGSNMLHIVDFRGSTSILLTAELLGGTGPNAWQHAQLFRVALESSIHPFVTKLHLRKKNDI